MLFNSFHFFLFLIVVVFLFFNLPKKVRWALLLIASYYFYMAWKAEYAILLVASTLIDFTAGIQIENNKTVKRKKLWLLVSIFTNIGMLCYFKYANFFIDNFQVFIEALGFKASYTTLHIILPMGISFYTFQTMAYSIDVYRKKIKAERHLGYFALYVTFFPQLVAGPIERAGSLLSQFREKVVWENTRIAFGVRQIIWGLFKKVVIADRLSVYVDQIYNSPEQSSGTALLIGTYLFAFQIYCDFSGYSDIAIGTARIFGIKLMDNFKVPYLASSLKDFWNRWHISLSTWFRDYLYISLGGNRVSKARWLFNLFIVFVISGFWHGASWTFIIWGAIHGGVLMLENLKFTIKKLQNFTLPKWIKVIWIFHIVLLAWVFFRANSLHDAQYIVSTIFSDLSVAGALEYLSSIDTGRFMIVMLILFAFIVADPFMDAYIIKKNKQMPNWLYHSVFGFLVALIMVFGSVGETKFIYFQF